MTVTDYLRAGDLWRQCEGNMNTINTLLNDKALCTRWEEARVELRRVLFTAHDQMSEEHQQMVVKARQNKDRTWSGAFGATYTGD